MEKVNGKNITNSYSYEEYREMVNDLFASGRTTGENHTESMMDYTKMNIQRMNRWDKKVELSEEMKDALSRLDCSFD